MENRDNQKGKSYSKATAAMAGLSLALGLGWTLSSGFKNEPSPLVTSHNRVEMSLPYSGVCRDLEIFSAEGQIEPELFDVRRGLARVSLNLEPGEHQLTLKFHGLIPGLEKEYPLSVTVDKTPPQLTASLADGSKKKFVTTQESVKLAGSLEEGCELTLEGESLENHLGKFESSVPLQAGWNHLLLTATDKAGNATHERFSVFRDTQDPVIGWQTKPDEIFQKKQARIVVQFEDDGSIVGVSGKVDGKDPVKWFAKGENRWVGVTPELHEGFHQVSVKAVDEGGRVVEGARQVIVDSSEALGEAVLGLGARGEDARLLNQRLADAGYMDPKSVSSVFDKNTEKAISELQKDEGYEITGKAEGQALVALGPRIFINLSNFSLVLDRPGKEQKRWMVASGSYAHPTPVGKFVIKEKVPHPTWLPPKSDWAKDAKPIPPGPGNPLGTRWLGFDWGGVGIHGTNAPWSIGSASSHGCLRMVTGQVEELYELVEVGTPVVVLGGWEEDPVLEKYWPSKTPEQEKAEPEKTADAGEKPQNDKVAQLDG
ncbi:MAG TPA: L,D-transpeptidase [Phycisphaerales bacterium]|nr:L,D-transpeptidase [Phycisphaerales bacterium]